jgi:hypothetical protein
MALKTLLATIVATLALASVSTALAGPPIIPPAAPTELGFDGYALYWTDNSDTEDGFRIRIAYDGTRVQHDEPANTTYVLIPPDATPQCPGPTSVIYDLTAFNAAGESEPATLTLTVDCLPAAPSNVELSFDRLSWTDTSDNENGFRIEIEIGAGTFQYEVAANVTSFSIPAEARTDCGTVLARVTAFNAFGESEPATAGLAIDCFRPPTPTPTVLPTALPPAGDGPAGAGPGDSTGGSGAPWWLLAAVAIAGAAVGGWLVLRRAR